MRILLCTRILEKSGVGSHVCLLAKTLKAEGHEVYIISSTNNQAEFLSEHDIPFSFLKFSENPRHIIKGVRQLKKFISNHSIDIVHCHHRICGLYMKIVSKITHVPFVWTNHADNIPNDFIHRKTTFYGSRAICVSSDLKRFCIDKLRIPDEKVTVVLNGIETDRYYLDEHFAKTYRKKHGLAEDVKTVVLFSRMAPIKGHTVLIDAVSKLSDEEQKRLHVVFTGGTTGEYCELLKTKINDLQLGNIFNFLGFVTPSEALSIADLVVLPSFEEGFGITAIESFLLKKPFLRTRSGGYTDMESYCIGVDVGDSDAIAKELSAFLAGKEYGELIERAYDFVVSECTERAMVSKTVSIYEECVAKK